MNKILFYHMTVCVAAFFSLCPVASVSMGVCQDSWDESKKEECSTLKLLCSNLIGNISYAGFSLSLQCRHS